MLQHAASIRYDRVGQQIAQEIPTNTTTDCANTDNHDRARTGCEANGTAYEQASFEPNRSTTPAPPWRMSSLPSGFIDCCS